MRCSHRWTSYVAVPKRCPKCKSPYWSVARGTRNGSRGPAQVEVAEDPVEIEYRCVVNFGLEFMERMKSLNPSWPEWSWEQRERALKAEKERGALEEI